MPTYAITFDLDAPEAEYRSLREAIKDYQSWWHFLERIWLIQTGESAPAVRDRLERHLYAGDDLLVVELEGEWASIGLSDDAARWLSDHLG